jgi:hypothetical protein
MNPTSLNYYLENSLWPFRTIRALLDIEDRQNISGKAFLYVLMFAGLFDASDARDKIYGVLGLAPNFRVAQITPNYNTHSLWSIWTRHSR